MADKPIQFLVNEDIKDLLSTLAKKKGLKTGAYIRQIIIEYLRNSPDLDIDVDIDALLLGKEQD